MHKKATLTVIAAAAVMTFAAPQSASALPKVDGAKQLNSSTVEKAHYRDRPSRLASWLLSPQLRLWPAPLPSSPGPLYRHRTVKTTRYYRGDASAQRPGHLSSVLWAGRRVGFISMLLRPAALSQVWIPSRPRRKGVRNSPRSGGLPHEPLSRYRRRSSHRIERACGDSPASVSPGLRQAAGDHRAAGRIQQGEQHDAEHRHRQRKMGQRRRQGRCHGDAGRLRLRLARTARPLPSLLPEPGSSLTRVYRSRRPDK